jgi:hypothetical protein
LLVWFKYANFMVAQTADQLARMGVDLSGWERVALPVGISFFTFQKLSYTIDVYRGRCRSIANIIDFSMYVALFPQLVAGPIVRFRDIHDQIKNRVGIVGSTFMRALYAFSWGLCKKVILADTCGRFADVIFSLSANDRHWTLQTAWLGALAYTLADLSGLFRILGHGHRTGHALRFSLSGKFQSSLQRRQPDRFLASLAYLLEPLVPGLSVHSVRWQPPRGACAPIVNLTRCISPCAGSGMAPTGRLWCGAPTTASFWSLSG